MYAQRLATQWNVSRRLANESEYGAFLGVPAKLGID